MANDTRPVGLIPITQPYGNMRVNYYIANTAVNIFIGQLVALNNSGQVQIVPVGANQPAIGVAVGFLDTTLSGPPSGVTVLTQGGYLPSSTDAYVAVTNDPQQMYLIEEDTGSTALTTAAIGAAGDFIYIAQTGSTVTGLSNTVLDRSTVAADTAGLLQLLQVQNIINQDGTVNVPGDYCKWVVRIANHQLNGTKLSLAV